MARRLSYQARENLRAKLENAREKGLCIYCFKKFDNRDFLSCESCRKRKRKITIKSRVKNKDNIALTIRQKRKVSRDLGRCTTCHNEVGDKRYKRCLNCRLKARIKGNEYYWRDKND